MNKARIRRKNRIIFSFIAVITLSFAIFLMAVALEDSIVFFYTPQEIKEKNIKSGTTIRLGGLVETGSLKEKAHAKHFIITDGNAVMPVIYHGILPDLFREGQGVVALGKIKDNQFYADEILAKHDENYMPAEVAKKLKDNGYWQHMDNKKDNDY